MRGMLEMTMGSRNTVPLRMLRIVPLGDFHIFFNLNSVPATKSDEKTHTRDGQCNKRNMRGEEYWYLVHIKTRKREANEEKTDKSA